MASNIKSNLWLCNLAIPGMAEKGGGSVVIVSSIGGLRGSAKLGAYGISKAADMQLTRSLAVEWGPKNVRINCVAPGLVKTDFARALWEDPERLKRTVSTAPLRRIGEPDEIGGVVAFLASQGGLLHDRHRDRRRRRRDDRVAGGALGRARRHSGVGRNPVHLSVVAWVPTFVGMTNRSRGSPHLQLTAKPGIVCRKSGVSAALRTACREGRRILMKRFGLLCAALLAACLVAAPAIAGKKDDTLVWATDRDNPIADPFYLNTRELVVIGHHVWDTLVIIDPKTAEIKPLLATKWTWVEPDHARDGAAQGRQVPLRQGDGRRRRRLHAQSRRQQGQRHRQLRAAGLDQERGEDRRRQGAHQPATGRSRRRSPISPASASSCRRATTTARR